MAERRNFVRLEKRLKIEFRQIVDKFANESVPPNLSYTESLSGNGLTLLAGKPAVKGTRYEIDIFIKDGIEGPVSVAGEVLGSIKTDDNQYEIKLKFIETDEIQSDRLSSYVMKEDLKVKKAKKEKK
jgi:hypothetical protein